MATLVVEALGLVAVFERCSNYPRDERGVQALADGLLAAETAMLVPAAEIVARCARESTFCPTDADLLTVAREIRDEHRRAEQRDETEDWRRIYGPPQPFNIARDFFARANAAHQRDAEMWAKLRQHLKVVDGKWPDWSTMARAARELGYEREAKAWETPGGRKA